MRLDGLSGLLGAAGDLWLLALGALLLALGLALSYLQQHRPYRRG
jgi:hypothetical protein